MVNISKTDAILNHGKDHCNDSYDNVGSSCLKKVIEALVDVSLLASTATCVNITSANGGR